RGGGPPPPVRNSLACQTKGPGPLLKRGWAPKKSGSLAGPPRGKASTRHDDRRSRARWNVDGDHKSSIWFSTTDGARELVCADVALSGNHCELRKRPFWKLLARADAVIDHSDASSIALHLAVDHAGRAQVRAQFFGGRAALCPGTHVRPTHASAAKPMVNDVRLPAAQYGGVFLLHSAICRQRCGIGGTADQFHAPGVRRWLDCEHRRTGDNAGDLRTGYGVGNMGVASNRRVAGVHVSAGPLLR